MDKWFEEKLERNKLREYTKRRLYRNSYFSNLFRILSLTNWIIILNLIIFLFLHLSIAFFGENILPLVALQANLFFSGTIWTIFTSMFLHIEIWHLLANMISLFFIGNFAEKLIGRKRFFWLYLISGLFAGLFYVTLSYLFGSSGIGEKIFINPGIFAVGASGAIFSLLGLLAILTPYSRVYLIGGPIIALILQSIIVSSFPSLSFIPILNFIIYFYLIFSIIAIFSFNPSIVRLAIPIKMPFWILPIIAIIPLVLIGLVVELPIGNTAHLGGLLVGLGYAYYLKNKYRKKTEMIRRIFSK